MSLLSLPTCCLSALTRTNGYETKNKHVTSLLIKILLPQGKNMAGEDNFYFDVSGSDSDDDTAGQDDMGMPVPDCEGFS